MEEEPITARGSEHELRFVHITIVRRRIIGQRPRWHGIGVHFTHNKTWNIAATYDGTTCKAIAHAVTLALEKMLRHPDELNNEWVLTTKCAYLLNNVYNRFVSEDVCEFCNGDGDPRAIERINQLLSRLPRRVEFMDPHTRNQEARLLAYEGLQRLYGTGDSSNESTM